MVKVAARIISPQSKPATTHEWHTTTLAEDFDRFFGIGNRLGTHP